MSVCDRAAELWSQHSDVRIDVAFAAVLSCIVLSSFGIGVLFGASCVHPGQPLSCLGCSRFESIESKPSRIEQSRINAVASDDEEGEEVEVANHRSLSR
jgi:hypothetical protein